MQNRTRSGGKTRPLFEPFAVYAGSKVYTVMPAGSPQAEPFQIDARRRRVILSPDLDDANRPQAIAQAIATAWVTEIAAYGDRLRAEWNRWDLITSTVDEQAITEDEVGPIFKQFETLRRLGVCFDPSFVSRIETLRQDSISVAGELEEDVEGPDIVGASNKPGNVFCADTAPLPVAVRQVSRPTPLARPQMLFVRVDMDGHRFPEPSPARDADGKVRTPNGRSLLSIAEASAVYPQWSQADLAEQWIGRHAKRLTPDDRIIIERQQHEISNSLQQGTSYRFTDSVDDLSNAGDAIQRRANLIMIGARARMTG